MAKKKQTLVDISLFQDARAAVDSATREMSRQSGKQSGRHSSGHSDTLADTQADTQTVRQSGRQSGKQSDILSPAQKAVLEYLMAAPNGVSRLADIESATGIPYGTVRGSISALHKHGIISKPRRFRNGMFQGFYVSVKDNYHRQSARHSGGQSLRHSDKQSGRHSDTLEEDNIYSLLLANRSLLYSNLDAIGFGEKQLEQIRDAWQLQGIDLEYLPSSLERAEFAVEHKTFKADDPLAYVFKSLMRGQFYKPPKFKSRAERVQHEVDPEEMKKATARLKQQIKLSG